MGICLKEPNGFPILTLAPSIPLLNGMGKTGAAVLQSLLHTSPSPPLSIGKE